jgi:hypothetical protein
VSRFSYIPNGVVATIEDALIGFVGREVDDYETKITEMADQIADSLYAAGHLKGPQ